MEARLDGSDRPGRALRDALERQVGPVVKEDQDPQASRAWPSPAGPGAIGDVPERVAGRRDRDRDRVIDRDQPDLPRRRRRSRQTLTKMRSNQAWKPAGSRRDEADRQPGKRASCVASRPRADRRGSARPIGTRGRAPRSQVEEAFARFISVDQFALRSPHPPAASITTIKDENSGLFVLWSIHRGYSVNGWLMPRNAASQ